MVDVGIKDLVDASKQLGEAIAKSAMFGAKSEYQGTVIAMHCLQTGMPVLDFQREFHLIDGKPSRKAESMLAAFNKAGGKHRWVADGRDGLSASIELSMGGETYVSTYTLAEAQAAGLVKNDSGWKKNPANMLRARAASNGIRMIYPEAAVGVYTPEEIADMHGTVDAATEDRAADETQSRGRGRPRKSDVEAAQASAPQAAVSAPAAAVEPSTANAAVVTPSASAAAPAVKPVASPAAAPVHAAPHPSTTSTTTPAGIATHDPSAIAPSQEALNRPTKEQLNEIVAIREKLTALTTETWQMVLQKVGCPIDPTDGKTRKLNLGTSEQASHVLGWLRTQLAKQTQRVEGKSLDNLATAIVGN